MNNNERCLTCTKFLSLTDYYKNENIVSVDNSNGICTEPRNKDADTKIKIINKDFYCPFYEWNGKDALFIDKNKTNQFEVTNDTFDTENFTPLYIAQKALYYIFQLNDDLSRKLNIAKIYYDELSGFNVLISFSSPYKEIEEYFIEKTKAFIVWIKQILHIPLNDTEYNIQIIDESISYTTYLTWSHIDYENTMPSEFVNYIQNRIISENQNLYNIRFDNAGIFYNEINLAFNYKKWVLFIYIDDSEIVNWNKNIFLPPQKDELLNESGIEFNFFVANDIESSFAEWQEFISLNSEFNNFWIKL